MFLVESQDYGAMFTRMWKVVSELTGIPVTDFDGITEKNIKLARKACGGRRDRMVWYLRYARHVMIKSSDALKAHQNDPRLKAMMLNPEGNPTDGDHLQNLPYQLEHFFALPIAKIRNFVFNDQPLTEVLNYFQQCEDEWKETTHQNAFEDPNVTVLIDFGDGMKWVDTGRPTCRKEANAMGHCGNGGRIHSGDHLLSLRRFYEHDGKTLQQPCLTFILNDRGALTEMKGRANEKPAERYHRYIVELLKLPEIKDIEGGGYLPQNNFAMSDLTAEQRDEVYAVKPEFMPWIEQLERTGTVNENMVSKMFNDIGIQHNHDVKWELNGETLRLFIDTRLWTSTLRGECFDTDVVNRALKAFIVAPFDEDYVSEERERDFRQIYKEQPEEFNQIVTDAARKVAAAARKKIAELVGFIGPSLKSHRFDFSRVMTATLILDFNAKEVATNIAEWETAATRKESGRDYSQSLSYNLINLIVEVTSGMSFHHFFNPHEQKLENALVHRFTKINAERMRGRL